MPPAPLFPPLPPITPDLPDDDEPLWPACLAMCAVSLLYAAAGLGLIACRYQP